MLILGVALLTWVRELMRREVCWLHNTVEAIDVECGDGGDGTEPRPVLGSFPNGRVVLCIVVCGSE